MRARNLLILVFALAILAGRAYAFEANMYIFAVSNTGDGVPAVLQVNVVPGHGDIAIDLGNSLVGESTQQSVRNAVAAATRLAGVDKNKYDYFVKIISPAARIDGPSAGLPIALAIYGALHHEDVPDYVGATGEIGPDGSVYPVSGIFEKAKAAHEVNVQIFLIPAGEVNVPAVVEEETAPGIVRTVEKTVNIVKYAKEHWGMSVYPVSNLSQAVAIVFNGERPELNIPTQPETKTTLVNFNPPPVTPNKSKDFNVIVATTVQNAEREVSAAKSCIANLVLRDQVILQQLKDLVPTAESEVNQAKKLWKEGYYYTTANYAFLAYIDARTVHLICEHPSLLYPDSIAFQDMLNAAESNAAALRQQLNDINMTTENYQWLGGARDRFIRAYDYLQRLSDAVQGGSMPPSPVYLHRLMSVDAWLSAARQMCDIAKSRKGGNPVSGLDRLAKQSIIGVEDVYAMTDTNSPTVNERISWAKTAYRMGWYYVAAIEAASARGIALGDLYASRGNPVDELANALSTAFAPAGMWDELYLYHAKYYYEAAKYYLRMGEKSSADDMAKTGLEIYYMAKSINDIDKAVAAAPAVRVNVVPSGKLDLSSTYAYIAVGVLLASIFILILLLAGARSTTRADHQRIRKKHQYLRKIHELERQIRELERKDMSDPEVKKQLANLRRQLGRVRAALRRLEAQETGAGTDGGSGAAISATSSKRSESTSEGTAKKSKTRRSARSTARRTRRGRTKTGKDE